MGGWGKQVGIQKAPMGGGASKQEFQKSQWEGGGKQVRKAKRPGRLKEGGGQASKTGRFRQRDEGGWWASKQEKQMLRWGGGQASKIDW